MAKGPEQTLLQEDIQRVQRRMKGCSASLAIREMKIKTTMSYHFTPVSMAIINKSSAEEFRMAIINITTSADKAVEKREPWYTVGWDEGK